jgi:predicted transcriptional regulator
MAAANESQGLKIAVSAFITLTVILTVTSYFLYSNALSAEARLDSERYAHKNTQDAHKRTKDVADLALRHYDEIRTRIGTKAAEFDPAMKEISANFEKVEERLNNLINAVNAAVQTAQQNGAQGPELEDVKLNVQHAIASYRSEPNKTYISSLDRLTDAMENLALLTTQLSLKYVGVRKSLEGATSGAKGQKDQGPGTKD